MFIRRFHWNRSLINGKLLTRIEFQLFYFSCFGIFWSLNVPYVNTRQKEETKINFSDSRFLRFENPFSAEAIPINQENCFCSLVCSKGDIKSASIDSFWLLFYFVFFLCQMRWILLPTVQKRRRIELRWTTWFHRFMWWMRFILNARSSFIIQSVYLQNTRAIAYVFKQTTTKSQVVVDLKVIFSSVASHSLMCRMFEMIWSFEKISKIFVIFSRLFYSFLALIAALVSIHVCVYICVRTRSLLCRSFVALVWPAFVNHFSSVVRLSVIFVIISFHSVSVSFLLTHQLFFAFLVLHVCRTQNAKESRYFVNE